MSTQNTPSKSLLGREQKITIPIERETVADVSKELDEYKRETSAELKSLQSQIDQLKEKLAVLQLRGD
jgi:hypothetical protein